MFIKKGKFLKVLQYYNITILYYYQYYIIIILQYYITILQCYNIIQYYNWVMGTIIKLG